MGSGSTMILCMMLGITYGVGFFHGRGNYPAWVASGLITLMFVALMGFSYIVKLG